MPEEYKCQACGAPFAAQAELQSHVREQHPEPPQQRPQQQRQP